MAVSRELETLLRELRSVRSPIQRMRILALGWRTVRRLTPLERKKIASQLGVKGLDAVLEKLGRKGDGISPAELLQVLEKADDLDGSKLRRLVGDLRDPERRNNLLRHGLDYVEDRLGAEEVEEIDEPSPEKAMERTAKPEEIEVPVVAPAPRPAPPAIEEEEAEGEPPKIEAELLESEQVGHEPELPAQELPAAEVPPPPRPVVSAPPPAVVEATMPPEEPERIDEETEPIAAQDAAPTPGEKMNALPLTKRFRLLRRLLEGEAAIGIDRAAELLEAFPDGWARRRALLTMLHAGAPSTTGDALELIERLERPADRRWCALALFEARSLSETDSRRLEERFPSRTLSRRLRRRTA
jgi:hypothetical protein